MHVLVNSPTHRLALAPMAPQRAERGQSREDDDAPFGFAVAVVREDATWRCSPLSSAALTSLATAETELRELRSAGAVFGLLVVYCLRNVELWQGSHGLPEALSIGVVAALHCWKRQMLLSIAGGTVCYMLLVQLVF